MLFFHFYRGTIVDKQTFLNDKDFADLAYMLTMIYYRDRLNIRDVKYDAIMAKIQSYGITYQDILTELTARFEE
jgi:hypothetical protein